MSGISQETRCPHRVAHAQLIEQRLDARMQALAGPVPRKRQRLYHHDIQTVFRAHQIAAALPAGPAHNRHVAKRQTPAPNP